MKAIVAVTCCFSAVVLISALTEEECREPRPFSSCDPQTTPKDLFYFNNGTNRCEKDFGCSSGGNNFPKLKDCQEGCPYGEHTSQG
uniref:Putative tick kunitz 53 n=1 Tax=Ixodes ricinus TaxID=34613 RepID=V5H7P9_IXORI